MPDEPKEQTATEPKVIEVPLEGGHKIKLGDWEGGADDFRKHWIPQSELSKMREKDKAELERQVKQQVEQERTRIAQQMQRQMWQQRQQPQQQANGFQSQLEQLYNGIAQSEYQGFVHVNDLKQLVSHLTSAVNSELQARDRLLAALGQRLDEWYGNYQEKSGVIDTLSSTYTDKQWGEYIDALEKKYPNLPRETIEVMASAYEAADDETPEQLREAIESKIGEHVKAMDTHRAKQREREREQQRKIVDAGIPGVGGAAAPSKPGKPLRDAGDIADHFYEAGDAPA